MCDAFVYEDQGCCNTSTVPTAFRKHFSSPDVAQQCGLAKPYARFYQRAAPNTSASIPAPATPGGGLAPATPGGVAASSSGSSTNVGAIVGGQTLNPKP